MRPLVLGLTGGIGSGKTSLARLLMGLAGWPCLDADRCGQEALTPESGIPPRLAERFGDEILAEEGSVRPEVLSRLVFQDQAALADLGAITHPWILRRLAAEGAALLEERVGDRILLLDAALLLDWLDRLPPAWGTRIVAVAAPLPARLLRLTARGLSEEEALRRIRAQRGDEEMRRRAHWVVENNGSRVALVQKSIELMGAVRSIKSED